MSGYIAVVVPAADRRICAGILGRRLKQCLGADDKVLWIGNPGTETEPGQDYASYPAADTDLRSKFVEGLRQAMPELGNPGFLGVAVAEDDDYYGDNYFDALKLAATESGSSGLIGYAPARYYNVETRGYAVLPSTEHASLAQTFIPAAALEDVKAAVSNAKSLGLGMDMALWRKLGGRLLECGDGRHCGMKGMPGQAGYGIGHRPDKMRYCTDHDYEILRRWTGTMAGEYIEICEFARRQRERDGLVGTVPII